MFEVTYYEMSDEVVDVKVDVVQFLHLLELYATSRYIRAITADFNGKSIDCAKLVRSLKFM